MSVGTFSTVHLYHWDWDYNMEWPVEYIVRIVLTIFRMFSFEDRLKHEKTNKHLFEFPIIKVDFNKQIKLTIFYISIPSWRQTYSIEAF